MDATLALAHGCLDAALQMHFCHLYTKSKNFVGLHEVYGDIYGELYNWFDRFAERSLAREEKPDRFTAVVDVPTGDCLLAAARILKNLNTLAKSTREQVDEATQAALDELVECIEKRLWQIRASNV